MSDRIIPVTKGFDKTDVIGSLTLRDGIDIPLESVFALGYTILEGTVDKPTKINVYEVSLISDSNYLQYLKDQARSKEEE